MDKIHGSLQVTLLAASMLVLVGGCANPLDMFDDDQWRTERVVQVLTATDLSDLPNRRCLGERSLPQSAQVAVLKIRVHRAPHLIALAIPPSLPVREGDNVSVNFKTCQLRLVPGSGD